MLTLLHLDCSARPESVSAQITAEFAAAWRVAHPEGRLLQRNLARHPVPHIDGAHIETVTRLETAGIVELEEARHAARTLTERRSWSTTWKLIDELLLADVLVIGLPVYHLSVPSVFKAWLDRIGIPPLFVSPKTGRGPLSGTRVVVATAHGAAYGQDVPHDDFLEPHLRAVFRALGLADDLVFLRAEMTKAGHVPWLAPFRAAAQGSLEQAIESAREAARR
ncbi:NAD(P)H-dependent oxidoreductase [Streptomyces sp. TRM S81-3]|uniref:FMN dependent NADH:quinone oxidoreductase n=1 Tax=Streptomyces griseicoloratus TaxID=2752516 RepID=A0A926QPJ1_9ACTN|nr:NAD(P)H-dependent oxidoreductase [Streptomyces griseicoloratus]MBD0418102.1 NAD(P)H-dependent oxidoreductase [Streptomyces griseicoloratus]